MHERARTQHLLPYVVLLFIAAGCSSAHEADDGSVPTDGTILTDGTTGHDGGGVVVLPDGAIILPDGGVVDPDSGVVVLPDGAVIFPDAGPPDDGSVVGHDGSVTLPDGGAVAHVGTPCTSDTDCPGLFCSPAGSGFGYCSWLCGPTMPCPGDAVCGYFSGTTSYGYCMSRCDPAAPTCAMGQVCQPGVADVPVCYPGCSTDADCPSGDRCGSGVSGVRSCYSPTSSVGDECTLSADCPDSGYCLDEASWGTPRGMCVTFCTLSTGAGCLSGTTCVAWGFMSGYGSCVPTCDDTHPCRAGYACVSTPSGDSACVMRCTSDTDCSTGHTCNFVTGRCG